MKQIRLIFGTHNSLPISNDKKLLESVYQKAYKPFISVLNRFPHIPVVLHYSGYLLEWIERKHPEFIMLLTEMVKRKQVEFLTGGFYEPVLTLIPNTDRMGQIEQLTTFIRGHFGKRPRGSWLTQKVWEPSLASILSTSGIEYTFLDESHFRHAGLKGEALNYLYLTEDQGKTLSVFPLSGKLSRLIPSASPEEAIKFLQNAAADSTQKVMAFIEDGEKFGYMDDSYKACYEKSWLEKFFTLLGKNSNIIVPVSPEQYVKENEPRFKIYIPVSVSMSMLESLLPPDRAKNLMTIRKKCKSFPDLEGFLGGALFRQFLSRYPEGNLMYARMMYTHLRVNQIRGDKYKKKTAREELWKGQCHHAYWQGCNGGIYWPHLRKALYRSFIEAEKITRSDGMFTPSIISFDFDMDGKKEYLFQGKEVNAYVHCLGGMLFELDFIPCGWNYGDSMARRPELYHNVGDRIYDRYMRKSFIDHFFSETETIRNFHDVSYKELGDFISREYYMVKLNREHRELVLSRDGRIKIGNRSYPVSLEKRYRFNQSIVQVDYTITNSGDKALEVRFGAEINLSFASGDSKDTGMYSIFKNKRSRLPNEQSSREAVEKLFLQDNVNKTNITITSAEPFSLWCLPVETVSRAFNEREQFYQSTCFVPCWRLKLEPSTSWQNSLSLGFAGK